MTSAFSVSVEMSMSQKSDVCAVVEFRYQHRICKTHSVFWWRGEEAFLSLNYVCVSHVNTVFTWCNPILKNPIFRETVRKFDLMHPPTWQRDF